MGLNQLERNEIRSGANVPEDKGMGAIDAVKEDGGNKSCNCDKQTDVCGTQLADFPFENGSHFTVIKLSKFVKKFMSSLLKTLVLNCSLKMRVFWC